MHTLLSTIDIFVFLFVCSFVRTSVTFVSGIYDKVNCLFDLILYVLSTICQLNSDGSSWVEPVLS